MIPLKGLSLEHDCNKDSKYCQRYYFLDDFQLHEVERTAVFYESDPVGRNLSAVFEECDTP